MTPPTSPPDLPTLGAQLLAILEAEISALAGLHDLVHRTRAAVGRADVEALHRLGAQQQQALAGIRGMEEQRAACAAACAPHLGTPRPRLDAIASALAGDAGARMREAGRTLAERFERVQRDSGLLATASRALDRHLDGVRRALRDERTDTYGREGRVAPARQLDFAVNLTS